MNNSQVPKPQPDSTGQSPASASMPDKKSIKMIGIIAGAVLVIITIAIVSSFFSVSKEEYRQAYDQMEGVVSANSSLNSKLSSMQYGLTSSTDTQFKNDVEAVEEAIEEVREENKELSTLKAIKVGEGKKQYDEFNKKLEEQLTFTSDAVKSISNIREASLACSAANSVITSSKSATTAQNECVSAFKKASDIPDNDVKTFVKAMVTEGERLASIMDKMVAITNPYGAQYEQYKSLRDEGYEVQKNIRDAQANFRSNFEKHAKEANAKDTAEDLSKFLSEQARR